MMKVPLALALMASVACAADDLPLPAFDGTGYGDWVASGAAFGKGPASGDLLAKLEIENAGDSPVACSEIDGDGPQGTLPLQPSGRLFHIVAEVGIEEGTRLVFNLRGVPVVVTARTLESGHEPATVQDRIRKIELLIDRTSIEAFANDGEISSTRYVLPRGNGLSVRAEGGGATIRSLKLHALDSAW